MGGEGGSGNKLNNMQTIMTDNAAHNLLNITLQTGWLVKEKIEGTNLFLVDVT